MATYYAANAGALVAPPKRVNQVGETLVYFRMVPTVSLATNDIIILAQVPVNLSSTSTDYDKRATYILGVHFQIGDVDSGTALVFDLGDAAGTVLTSLTGGRAAGPFVVSSFDPAVGASAATGSTSGHWGAGVWPRRYTAATDVRMTVTTGATGLQATPGAIQGYVRYTLAESV